MRILINNDCGTEKFLNVFFPVKYLDMKHLIEIRMRILGISGKMESITTLWNVVLTSWKPNSNITKVYDDLHKIIATHDLVKWKTLDLFTNHIRRNNDAHGINFNYGSSFQLTCTLYLKSYCRVKLCLCVIDCQVEQMHE